MFARTFTAVCFSEFYVTHGPGAIARPFIESSLSCLFQTNHHATSQDTQEPRIASFLQNSRQDFTLNLNLQVDYVEDTARDRAGVAIRRGQQDAGALTERSI